MASAAKIVASAQITKDPGVCSGAACIDDTRIRVFDVVQARDEGHTPEQIQELFASQGTSDEVLFARVRRER